MSDEVRARLRDAGRLVLLSARMVAGRKYWLAPLVVLAWPVFQLVRLLVGWRPDRFLPEDAQGALIGFPLAVLAAVLGARVIAGEIDRRTLEIAYTVPGGTQRVWLSKLAAAMILLLAAEAALAGVTFLFFTDFPPGALYGALQAAAFYLVAAMALSALFKSEPAGALVTALLLFANGFFTGFGVAQLRASPFWNPAALGNVDPADVLAWTVQNRVGFALVIVALVTLAFARAERREALLGG